MSAVIDLRDAPADMPSDLHALADEAVRALRALVGDARRQVRARVATPEGRIAPERLEAEQHAAHALAWLATYAEAVAGLAAYAARLDREGRLGPTEALIVRIGLGEYLEQAFTGIPMSQTEVARPTASLGLARADVERHRTPAVEALIADGNTPANRAALVARLDDGSGRADIGNPGLDDTLEEIRATMARFATAEVEPHAHGWHLADDYIPLSVVERMGELGVFGLTIPEEFGGLGLSKVAMCVVSEELSRAYIGVGSLGTRSEIAAELILAGGTPEQKARFLPAIASGAILPTAVFTEPDTGSDLAALRTRAVRDGDVWRVYGAKTWITHPVRADLMTILVRTRPDQPGHRGLSILLAEKPRGTDADPFPVEGLDGGEIHVLGYRGMKEYELSFDGFAVSAENLLGGVEGEGFRQLMNTFESARIQTGARAVGVAVSALDLALRYANERRQFGKALKSFPRVGDKLATMAVDAAVARQLTYGAGRTKDEGRRCDLEAGMAKLLAARVAWSSADSAVQIHGGNGFALDYPVSRVLCDARILSIFEGAAEIQAQVIARRLLEVQ